MHSVHKNVFPKITAIISEQRQLGPVMGGARQFSTEYLT